MIQKFLTMLSWIVIFIKTNKDKTEEITFFPFILSFDYNFFYTQALLQSSVYFLVKISAIHIHAYVIMLLNKGSTCP